MHDSIQQLLVIDDEENMRHMLSAMLSRQGYVIETVSNGKDGLALLQENKNKINFDFVLCDIKMPVMDGMEFLRRVKEIDYNTTIIMMSAYGSMDSAIEAMQLGAYDYISKPFKAEEILLVLKKAEERERLQRENAQLRRQLSGIGKDFSFGRMIGKSREMQEIFRLASKVAPHPTTVLITGASGTGKELLARGIHDVSNRADKSFIAVNCGSIPETLLESELFGYIKGAFTGADRNKTGLFVEADGGTLFLDEIGELPLSMQVKLLRVIQEQEIQPLGSTKPQSVNVRLLAATARDLVEEVKQGRFREDLLFRLNVIHLHIPALSRRLDDLPLLCSYFVEKLRKSHNVDIQGIAPATMTLLLKHSWPGNVRQLENVIERAVILAEKNVILPENLPSEFGIKQDSRRLDDFFSGFSIKKAQKIMEKSLISRALEATGGNKSKAADLLELSYPSLLSKIKEYNVQSKRTGTL